MFLTILAIILTVILVVGIHEAAHALIARIFKVSIKKISIGFGKSLLQWKSDRGCEWVFALIPLGGYVQLQNTRISPTNPKEYPHCFDKKPIWQRVLILLAGSMANLITAWLGFIVVFILGFIHPIPEIQQVQPNSISAKVGMLPDDQFKSIGGYVTQTWSDVGMQFVIYLGKKNIPVILSRPNGQEVKMVLDLSQVTFRGMKSLLAQLGIKPNLSAKKSWLQASSIGDAIHKANETIIHTLYFFIMVLKQVFSGVIPFSALLGPLGIFAASISSLMQGIIAFIFFISSLSLAVGFVNLVPIPGLDGGSIMYAFIEKVRGKPISIAMEVLLHRLAFIVFCVLLVNLLINDLQRI